MDLKGSNVREIVNEMAHVVTEKVHEFVELTEIVTENDFFKAAEEISSTVGVISKGANYLLQKKFEMFLKGFNENELPTQEQIDKLAKYIDNESKAEFVANTLSNILLSRSSKACLIMGSIMNSMVENKEDLKHEHLICIYALLNFFDMDLTNYKLIYEFMQNNGGESVNLYSSSLRKKVEDAGLNWTSIHLTIDRSVTNQVINKHGEIDVDVDVDEDFDADSSGDYYEYFRTTEPGNILYKHIVRCRL
jgi:hypothetical protein